MVYINLTLYIIILYICVNKRGNRDTQSSPLNFTNMKEIFMIWLEMDNLCTKRDELYENDKTKFHENENKIKNCIDKINKLIEDKKLDICDVSKEYFTWKRKIIS